SQPAAVAEIRPVDPLFAGKVRTPQAKLICIALSLVVLLGVFGPIGLGLLGGWIAFPDQPPAGGVSLGMKALGGTIIAIGVAWFLANLVLALGSPGYFSRRYLLGRLRREFAQRPHHLVAPDDLSADFVELVPRENWGKLKLDDASDIGLLRIAPEGG